LAECKKARLELEEQVSKKRKTQAKLAPKRDAAAADNNADMLAKIDEYEKTINAEIDALMEQLGANKKTKKALVARYEELEAEEESKKAVAKEAQAAKRKEREAEKAAEKQKEADAAAAAKAEKKEARAAKEAVGAGSLTHLLLEDPDEPAAKHEKNETQPSRKRGAAEEEETAAGSPASRKQKRVKMDDEDDEEEDAPAPAPEEDKAVAAAEEAVANELLRVATSCATAVQVELDKVDAGSLPDDEALSGALTKLEELAMDMSTLAGSGVGKPINKLARNKTAAASLAAYAPRAKMLVDGYKKLAGSQ